MMRAFCIHGVLFQSAGGRFLQRAQLVKLCFLAHYAGAGIINSCDLGISGPVLLGVLPRLAGADSVMTMTAKESTPAMMECLQIVQKHKLPMGGLPQIMTSLGGGVTPLTVGSMANTFGSDIILGVGGAVQGHPMGTTAGSKAVMDALDAAMKGIDMYDAAKASTELKTAIDAWSMQ